MQYLQRYLTTCQALLYTKPNQPVMTITTPNGFRIGPSTTEIRGVSKCPLAVNNPVVQVIAVWQGGWGMYSEYPSILSVLRCSCLSPSPVSTYLRWTGNCPSFVCPFLIPTRSLLPPDSPFRWITTSFCSFSQARIAGKCKFISFMQL